MNIIKWSHRKLLQAESSLSPDCSLWILKKKAFFYTNQPNLHLGKKKKKSFEGKIFTSTVWGGFTLLSSTMPLSLPLLKKTGGKHMVKERSWAELKNSLIKKKKKKPQRLYRSKRRKLLSTVHQWAMLGYILGIRASIDAAVAGRTLS